MRIANWVIAVSLTGWLLSGSLVAADGADALFDVVIVHGRVMDPETNLDAVRNVGSFAWEDSGDFGKRATRQRNHRGTGVDCRARVHRFT